MGSYPRTLPSGDQKAALDAATGGPLTGANPVVSAEALASGLSAKADQTSLNAVSSALSGKADTTAVDEAVTALEELIVGKADTSHQHALDGASVTGVLPVARGGTGATTAADARTALELGDASTRSVGVAGGVAELDGTGKVPASQLPTLGGVSSVGATSPLQSSGGSTPTLSLAAGTNEGDLIAWSSGTWGVARPRGRNHEWLAGYGNGGFLVPDGLVSTSSAVAVAADLLRGTWFEAKRTAALSRVAVHVANASPGAVGRVHIYAPASDGSPGLLVAASDELDLSAVGRVTAVISGTLVVGTTYLVVLHTGGAAASLVGRGNTSIPYFGIIGASSTPSLIGGVSVALPYGTPPASFPAAFSTTASNNIPLVGLR